MILAPARPSRGRAQLLIGCSMVRIQRVTAREAQAHQARQLTACRAALMVTEAQLTSTSTDIALTLTARALTKVSVSQMSLHVTWWTSGFVWAKNLQALDGNKHSRWREGPYVAHACRHGAFPGSQ